MEKNTAISVNSFRIKNPKQQQNPEPLHLPTKNPPSPKKPPQKNPQEQIDKKFKYYALCFMRL